MRVCHAILALAVIACPRPAAAQAQKPLPAESTLAGIEARGMALYGYDQAAWHGTDAVLALHPAEGLVTTYIARHEGAQWTVYFGRPNGDTTAFLVAFEARAPDTSRQFTAVSIKPPRPDSGFLIRAARAISLSRAALGSVQRPYNVAVLPAANGSWWVYVYPAPTTDGVWPLGGDTRYLVSADGRAVVDQRRMHNAVIDYTSPASGDSVSSGWHTAILDDLPEDSDVFFVLERQPPLPEMIVSRSFMFRIATDGRITCVYRTSK